MSVVRYVSFTQAKNESSNSVICLGNFDGVHTGHAKLLEETVKLSGAFSEQTRACALCFDPFPSDFFSKLPLRHIMTLDEKLTVFKQMGLDGAYICDFSKVYDYTPEKFINEILIGDCGCKGVVCGFNYRFGKGASGTPEMLAASFDRITVVEPFTVKCQTVSSSLIKESIESGLMEEANEMLGRAFSISHTVVHGKNLGTKLGFPTINHIFSLGELIPAFGIYATVTAVEENEYISVTNVGTRPTVSDSDIVTCETYIINCPEGVDLYDKEVKINFFKKIRNEKRFSSLEELSCAIAADVENTKKFFGYGK